MNEDTLAGKLKSVGGKIEQAVGEAIGNQKMANAGTGTQVKGATQETWGNVKDAAHDVTGATRTEETGAKEHAESSAHDARNSIANAAEHAKDSVSHGVEKLRDEFHEEREVHQVQ